MIKWIKLLIKQLFCKHEYNYEYICLVDTGMRKLYKMECKKCGYIKYKAL